MLKMENAIEKVSLYPVYLSMGGAYQSIWLDTFFVFHFFSAR